MVESLVEQRVFYLVFYWVDGLVAYSEKKTVAAMVV